MRTLVIVCAVLGVACAAHIRDKRSYLSGWDDDDLSPISYAPSIGYASPFDYDSGLRYAAYPRVVRPISYSSPIIPTPVVRYSSPSLGYSNSLGYGAPYASSYASGWW